MKKLLLLSLLCLPWLLWAQTPDRELYTEAETRFRNHDYELALDRYSALISQYPLSQYVPDAQFRRAVSLYRLQRYDESLRLFQRVETRYRSTQYLRFVPFWKGVVEYYLKQYPGSIIDLNRFMADSGANRSGGAGNESDLSGQALLYRGLDEISLGHKDQAISSIESLVASAKSPSSDAYGLSLLMSLYREQKAYEKMIGLYRKVDIKAVDPAWRDRIELYAAEAFYNQGDSASAAPLYTDLENADPTISAVAFQRLFQIAQSNGDTEAQDRILRSAETSLAGRSGVLSQFWLTVAIESYNSGKYDVADLYFQRIWDLRSTQQIDGSVSIYLAEIAVRRNDLAGATAYLETYLELLSSWKAKGLTITAYEDRVLLRLGGLYLQQEEWKTAADTFSRLRTEMPDSPLYSQASYQYAYSLYRQNDLGNALSVADDLFSRGDAGAYSGELLRLKASILRKQGQMANAIQSLKEYLVQQKDDTAARVEYLKMLFQDKRYASVIPAANSLLSDVPDLARNSPSEYVQVKYVLGVSYISIKDYQDALAQLREFRSPANLPAALKALPSLSALYPYDLFYIGWANYRIGNYREAISAYGDLLKSYPSSSLAARSSYLAGWSAYSIGDYSGAEQFLGKVKGLSNDQALVLEAEFLLGQSYEHENKYEQAGVEFKNIYVSASDSSLADDARFEYARTLASLGRIDEAAAAYEELYKQYPSSQLAEQGLFNRADLFYKQGRFADAREAFFFYRSSFPNGRLVDAALYWGGMASNQLNEPSGALLLWERLIAQQRTSSYRSDAMYRAAGIYEQRGDYRSALNLYTEMVASYPDEAKAVGAQQKADELVLRIGGLSEQEASLWVTINNDGKASTDKGRQAILKLGQLVISQGDGKSVNQDVVLPLIQEVANHTSDDATAASQAKFLLAEVYAKQPDYLKAASTYLDAAVTNPADSDLAALCLYRAAEMYQLAGRAQQTNELVARIEKDFPKSEWAAEAQKLLEN